MADPRPPESVTLPRVSKGPRPHFFDDPSIDQIMTFFFELMTEVAVLRERTDTIERLLDANGTVSRADIEAYRADPAVEAERNEWRNAYFQRVMRMHGAS
ncbi:hypothetical protein [uncultured Sphingomonas sp.]|jgi:hypothetical protein|uniref:hypothetical protein n=1 Tax=unclassified Sphingomonas TaxID=196159 RepID=UPI0025DCC7C9|nr:hypothetical protein [uncultured Sphingomonas sp.]